MLILINSDSDLKGRGLDKITLSEEYGRGDSRNAGLEITSLCLFGCLRRSEGEHLFVNLMRQAKMRTYLQTQKSYKYCGNGTFNLLKPSIGIFT